MGGHKPFVSVLYGSRLAVTISAIPYAEEQHLTIRNICTALYDRQQCEYMIECDSIEREPIAIDRNPRINAIETVDIVMHKTGPLISPYNFVH